MTSTEGRPGRMEPVVQPATNEVAAFVLGEGTRCVLPNIVRLTDAKIVVWSMYPAGLLTNILPKRNA